MLLLPKPDKNVGRAIKVMLCNTLLNFVELMETALLHKSGFFNYLAKDTKTKVRQSDKA